MAFAAGPAVPPIVAPAPVPPVLSAATLPHAGFWIRLGALAVDVVLCCLVIHLLPWVHFRPSLCLLLLAVYGAVMWKLRGNHIFTRSPHHSPEGVGKAAYAVRDLLAGVSSSTPANRWSCATARRALGLPSPRTERVRRGPGMPGPYKSVVSDAETTAGHHEAAEDQARGALRMIQEISAAHPGSAIEQAELANMSTRLAQILIENAKPKEAVPFVLSAASIMETQVKSDPANQLYRRYKSPACRTTAASA